MAERARIQPATHQAIDTAPPPPYTESNSDSDSDSDSDDEDSMNEPMKLVINASHSVHGSNNLVPTSPTALADATKFSTILLTAIAQLNAAANVQQQGQTRRPLRVDLTINCGIAVVGNRNVIGNIGLRPKTAATPSGAFTAADAVLGAAVGAKRKAEADDDDTDSAEPAAKRLATEAPIADAAHVQALPLQ